jgi:hypothetical protein
MRKVVDIGVHEVIPNEAGVMALQSIPATKKPPKIAIKLFRDAKGVFLECACPVGLIGEISLEEFEDVYRGQSLNEKDTPVPGIAMRSAGLALFAVTLGKAVHDKINELFEVKELALGSMLDSVASAAAEKAADIVQDYYIETLKARGLVDSNTRVMRYSPGYCGWHVSGQKKLFQFLRPEDIGITLRESFLMEPLKSVSGVLIAGKREIHIIKDDYPFCSTCDTHSCQERARSLFVGNDNQDQ